MAARPTGHKWQPLADLSHSDRAAVSDELPALAATWQEQRARLDADQVEEFNERLQLEWAIETGIIENLYTLDRGTTQLLIEQGIDASLIGHDTGDRSPELVAGIISDQKAAVDWLFELVKQDRSLSVSFVKQLHALMTRRQTHVDGVDQFGTPTKTELRHGEFKDDPNNPSRPDGEIHEYCPPLQVGPEMDRLVELHHKHMAEQVPPEVAAAWVHHRFAQIHPFQDGNGRVARALASLVLIRAGWFPLVITRDDRVPYIEALETADRGDLRPLVDLTVTIEKRAFVRALSIAEQVKHDAENLDQVVEAIGAMFSARDEAVRTKLDQAKDFAHRLWNIADNRILALKDDLENRIGSGTVERRVMFRSAANDNEDRRRWNRYQVTTTASKLDYVANIAEFQEWSQLLFETESGRSELLVSFHGIGQEYRGVIGVSACFYRRQAGDDIENQIVQLEPVVDDVFQVNYYDKRDSVERRFRPWLEAALLRGLDQWRRGE